VGESGEIARGAESNFNLLAWVVFVLLLALCIIPYYATDGFGLRPRPRGALAGYVIGAAFAAFGSRFPGVRNASSNDVKLRVGGIGLMLFCALVAWSWSWLSQTG